MTDEEIAEKIDARVKSALERYFRPLSWAMFAVACLLVVGQVNYLVLYVPKFETMFKEMDIGELPVSTRALLILSRFAIPLGAVALGAAIWCHVTRRWGMLMLLSALIFAAYDFERYALYMPLMKIMDRLGGGQGGT